MQDRFRCRIWNNLQKEMYYGVGFIYVEPFIHVDCGYTIKMFTINEVKPMQCTGLKDKNGKLIYEGDIVIQREENAGPTKQYVLWEKDGGYLGLKDLKKSFYGVTTFHRFGYTYEVIGNIYENSELLEDNK